MKNSFLRKDIKIDALKGVIYCRVNKIKNIFRSIKTKLFGDKNLLTVILVTSLFWVSVWGIDEVKDTEKHTKLRTEHSMLVTNYNSLYKVCQNLEENNVKLQKIIRDQGIMLHKAENFINEQKKIAGWAYNEER